LEAIGLLLATAVPVPRTVSYTRKRRESACYNGEEFERFTFMESCVCTDDDYEYDIGYMRQGSQPCSLSLISNLPRKCVFQETKSMKAMRNFTVSQAACNPGVTR